MPSIKLTREVGGHKTDAVIEVTSGAAEYLIDQGYAEPVKSPAKRGGGDSPA